MTVGEGIFWGAIVLALFGLYTTTKDRWQWKRIATWGVGALLLLVAVGILGVWGTESYENRVQPVNSFGGLTLKSTEDDVRFTKGDPSEVADGLWLYYAGSGAAKPENAVYAVRFKDNKVRLIGYAATLDQVVTPDLQGFTIGASYAQVIEKLGHPDHLSVSDDGLKRMASYSRLNTFYTFERAKVKDLGIYDPGAGLMEFRKATSAPQSVQSAPQRSAGASQGGFGKDDPVVLDHCAPGLSKQERLKRLEQHGTVRETGAGQFEAGMNAIVFSYDGSLAYCR